MLKICSAEKWIQISKSYNWTIEWMDLTIRYNGGQAVKKIKYFFSYGTELSRTQLNDQSVFTWLVMYYIFFALELYTTILTSFISSHRFTLFRSVLFSTSFFSPFLQIFKNSF